MGITLLRNKSAVREYLNHYIYIPLIILQYSHWFCSIIQLGQDIYKCKLGHIIASQALKYGIVFRYSQYESPPPPADMFGYFHVCYICMWSLGSRWWPPPPSPRMFEYFHVCYLCMWSLGSRWWSIPVSHPHGIFHFTNEKLLTEIAAFKIRENCTRAML